ncbi:putative membrane protein YkoI [Beijerinckia sp. GAS462]|nr:putative membrane protein YkoI [Beijerinckia sp. GAS462]SEC37678.1 Peptidase propeptide and YPEB domain-containing protein [Beijerinckia sp. 28-YEA-48]
MGLRFLAAGLIVMAGLLSVQHVQGASDCDGSQNCALDARKQGEIRPLSEVLAVARQRLPGEVIKIELDRDDGVWVYEIKILTPRGRRREIEINAQTLEVIKSDKSD